MRNWVLKPLLLALMLAAINYSALLNGFPLLYSDSGTYIVAGFDGSVPVDRPYFYPFFVRHTSLAFSLWLVLLAQSIVLLSVTRLALRYILQLDETFISSCLLLTGLGLTTSLSYTNGQIMADIFTPIMFIAFGVLLAGKNIRGWHRAWLVLVFLFSISVHSSHLPIITCLALLLLLFKLILRKKQFFITRAKGHNRLIGWSLASWLVVSLCNYGWGAGFKPSKTGNIFLMGRMIETGSANAYLQSHCQGEAYSLCGYKDSLSDDTNEFLWTLNSPLYKGGCADNGWGDCWIQKDKEYGKMVKNMLLFGPSLKLFINESLKDSWKQIFMFDCVYLTPQGEGSHIYGGIEGHFSADMGLYKNSRQYTETLNFNFQNQLQKWMAYISLLVLLVFSFFYIRKKEYTPHFVFAGVLIIGALVNAAVCASLSCATERYMSRVIWLLPLATALLIWQWAINYKIQKLKKGD